MQYFPQFTPPVIPGFLVAFLPLIIVIALWTVIAKGFALWHSARNSQKWWFIALLVVNTLGILEVIYLIWFRTKSPSSNSTPAHDSSVQA